MRSSFLIPGMDICLVSVRNLQSPGKTVYIKDEITFVGSLKSMPAQNTLETCPILHDGICPSCGEETSFDLVGIQQWPEKVAEATGLPAIQTMWQCRDCDTTLLEASLKPDQSAS